MPRNPKMIDWTAENDAKLLLTIIVVENVRPNTAKIAAAFGDGVGATAIASRLARLRQRAKAKTLPAGDGSSPAKSTNVHGSGSRAGKQGRTNGANRGKPANDDDSDDEGMNTGDILAEQLKSPSTSDYDRFATPVPNAKGQKVHHGRVTKARKSPRAIKKKDYKALEDPFITTEAVDGDGERVFATDQSDSEDSCAGDMGYVGGDKEAVVKVEESVEMEEAV